MHTQDIFLKQLGEAQGKMEARQTAAGKGAGAAAKVSASQGSVHAKQREGCFWLLGET
jgi:hypothetical protein